MTHVLKREIEWWSKTPDQHNGLSTYEPIEKPTSTHTPAATDEEPH
jgi:hypothetical protein